MTERQTIVIDGMKGLGDNLYQRAFVRAYVQRRDEVHLITPWPQLYADLAVECHPSGTVLRTQAKNERSHERYRNRRSGIEVPVNARRVVAGYGPASLQGGSMLASLEASIGIAPLLPLDLPPVGPSPVAGHYAVVRPVTERREWFNPARNPDPAYVNHAAALLRREGYAIVSVADLEDGKEWLAGEAPAADIVFHAGELSVEQLLALIVGARACVGGVGWLLPACIAAGVPLFCILGGQGAYNAPEKLTDGLEADRVTWAMPANFCRCANKLHACDKTVPDLDRRIDAWLRSLPAAT